MSFETWHNYGMGICTDVLDGVETERVVELLRLAPKYKARIDEQLRIRGVVDPTIDDYLAHEIDGDSGVACIMARVITEAERIYFISCTSFDGHNYLLFPPSYPWNNNDKEQTLTEDAVKRILEKYIGILSDEIIEPDYQSVEGGG